MKIPVNESRPKKKKKSRLVRNLSWTVGVEKKGVVTMVIGASLLNSRSALKNRLFNLGIYLNPTKLYHSDCRD